MSKPYILYMNEIARQTELLFSEEYMFHPNRKWRFDFAFKEIKLAIEFDGGNWIQGRHNSSTGRKNDIEKFNAAQDLGWKVYCVLPDEVDVDSLIKSVKIRKKEMGNGN